MQVWGDHKSATSVHSGMHKTTRLHSRGGRFIQSICGQRLLQAHDWSILWEVHTFVSQWQNASERDQKAVQSVGSCCSAAVMVMRGRRLHTEKIKNKRYKKWKIKTTSKQCDDRQSSFPGIQQTKQIPLGASWALDVDRPMIDTNDADTTQVPYPFFCFNVLLQCRSRHPSQASPTPSSTVSSTMSLILFRISKKCTWVATIVEIYIFRSVPSAACNTLHTNPITHCILTQSNIKSC